MRSGKHVCLHNVCDEAKVATCLAVAEYTAPFRIQKVGDPTWNNSRISTIRILSLAEHVEVTQSNRSQSIRSLKHFGVHLSSRFRRRVRRQGSTGVVLYLRQFGPVAVH